MPALSGIRVKPHAARTSCYHRTMTPGKTRRWWACPNRGLRLPAGRRQRRAGAIFAGCGWRLPWPCARAWPPIFSFTCRLKRQIPQPAGWTAPAPAKRGAPGGRRAGGGSSGRHGAGRRLLLSFAFSQPFGDAFGNPPASATIAAQARDLLQRVADYHQAAGKWPETGGDRPWQDLGLNPDDWRGLRDGIAWGVGGDTVTLGNQAGDKADLRQRPAGQPAALERRLAHLVPGDGWPLLLAQRRRD